MAKKRSKSDYYKLRTKKWLIGIGFKEKNIAYVERARQNYDPKRQRIFWKKEDTFGADIVAMDTKEMVWIQVQYGRYSPAEHIKRMASYDYPDFVERWIVWWRPEPGQKRIAEPQLINVKEVQHAGEKKD